MVGLKKDFLRFVLIAIIVTLFILCISCAVYTKDTLAFPERVQCSTAEQVFIGDKIYYAPWALANDLLVTIEYAIQETPNWYLAPITVPLSVSTGFIYTSVDTGLNLGMLVPLEIYEAATKTTLKYPYVPLGKALLTEASYKEIGWQQ